MKKVPKDRKRVIAGVIAVFLAVLMILGSLAPFIYGSEISDIEISAQLGYSGSYKVGYPVPINIKLINHGSAFKGEVNLKLNLGDIEAKSFAIHSYPLDLPANGQKEITMSIPIKSILQDRFQTISVVNEKGQIEAVANVSARAISPKMVMAGVLSDSPNTLSYLKAMKLTQDADIGEQPLKEMLINLDEFTFPDQLAELSAFNIIIINDFDIGRLSELKQQTLQSWVYNGGFLLLGTGANYQKVMKHLENPLEITDFVRAENKTITYQSVKENTKNLQWDLLETEISLADFDILRGYAYLTEEAHHLYSTMDLGKGRIFIAAFDLGQKPLNESGSFTSFFETIILNEFSNVYLEASDDYKSFRNINRYSSIPYLGDQTMVFIFVLIGLYIVCIGPVLYQVLKKRDQREKGFVIIPCISISLTILIYLLSYNTIYKKPVTNSYNMVNLYNKEQIAFLNGYTGALISQKGDIHVEMANVNSTASVLYYESGYKDKLERDLYKIAYGENQNITFYDCVSWSTNVLHYSQPLELGGDISIDAVVEEGIVSGVIRNNTLMPLDDIILVNGGAYTFIPYLEPGGGKEFILQNDTEDKVFKNFNFLDLDRQWDNDNANYLIQERRQKQKKDILRDVYKSVTSYSYDIDTNMGQVSAVSDKIYSVPLYLFAFSDIKIDDTHISVNKMKPIEFQLNLFTMEIPLDLIGEGAYQLPYDVISLTELYSETSYELFSEGQITLFDRGDTYFYYPMPETDRVFSFTFTEPEVYEGSYESISIYNNALNDWEELFYETYNENPLDYFDALGRIVVRVHTLDDAYMDIPTFMVEGGARVDSN